MLRSVVDGAILILVLAVCIILGYGAAALASCQTIECDTMDCSGVWSGGALCTGYSQLQAKNVYSPGAKGGTLTATFNTIARYPNCSVGCSLGCGTGINWNLAQQEAICGTGCANPEQITQNVCAVPQSS